MGAATYDAWAAFGSFMANALMRRAEAKDEDERYAIRSELAAKAQDQREALREARAAKRRDETPTDRKIFQGDASQGPPELMAEETNAYGAPIRTSAASQREKQEFAANAQNTATATAAEREKLRIAEEDRMFKREGELSRRANDSRRTAATESRANRPTATKSPGSLSKKEALAAISSFEYRADKENGETWQDVAKRGGVDVDSLLSAANIGAETKKPGALERGMNAVGGAISSIASKFVPKEGKSIMAQREPGKKAEKPATEKSPYPEGTRLRGPGGKIFIIRNGEPVPEGS